MSVQLQAQFFVATSGEVFTKASPLSRREKKRVFDRDGGVCRKCGCRVRFGGNTTSPFSLPGHIDHIFPRARGGQNDDVNLRLLCISCNTAKGAR